MVVKQLRNSSSRRELATFYLTAEKYLLGDTRGSVSIEGLTVWRCSQERAWRQLTADGVKPGDAQIQEQVEGVESAWLDGYRRGPLSTYGFSVNSDFKNLPSFRTVAGDIWALRNPDDFKNHCQSKLLPSTLPPPPKPQVKNKGADNKI